MFWKPNAVSHNMRQLQVSFLFAITVCSDLLPDSWYSSIFFMFISYSISNIWK